MILLAFDDGLPKAPHDASLGYVDLRAPVLFRLFGWIGLAIFAAVLLALLMVSVTRQETVRGHLVARAGTVDVVPAASGTVVRVHVAEGAVVGAGDALVELSAERESAGQGPTQRVVSHQLDEQRSRLRDDLRDLAGDHAIQRDDLARRAALAAEQMKQLDRQIALQTDRQRALDEALAIVEAAQTRGLVSELQLVEQRHGRTQALADLEALRRTRTELESQSAALQAERALLPTSTARRRRDIERQLAAIASAMAESEAQRSIVLRASTSGRVANLAVREGQSVEAGQRVLSVLPEDATLDAEVWVPSRVVGALRPGDRVRLRLDAFPYQRFGRASGRVDAVSGTATSPAELSARLGTTVDEPRYRVRIRLDSQRAPGGDAAPDLRPGMTFDADFALESRRLIDLLAGAGDASGAGR